MALSTPLGVLALGGGVALIWSAVTGDGPLAELRKALSSGKVDGGKPTPIEVEPLPGNVEGIGAIGTPLSGGTSGTGGVGAIGTPISQGPPTTQRVRIGQGGHTLNPAAANAFRQAEQNYGRTIPITDSSRDYDTQAANRARDPDRFGPPDGNAHVEGRAVDVNLPALGLNPRGEPSEWLRDPGYRKLVEAMGAAGWCNYQVKNGTANGRTREPWHFALGRCN